MQGLPTSYVAERRVRQGEVPAHHGASEAFAGKTEEGEGTRQVQLATALVLYPDSFASPGDFPLSDVVEISRLRFTSLEMTDGIVSLEMTDGVVAGRDDR